LSQRVSSSQHPLGTSASLRNLRPLISIEGLGCRKTPAERQVEEHLQKSKSIPP